ncbi:MAG: amidohydrolase family protein [Phycisphaerales bacterium]|nr:amidohydrolase family protein [Phycisphaerales bacterium]
MILDVHCHYCFSRYRAADIERFAFEDPEPAAPDTPDAPPLPTDFDSCISPRVMRRPAWWLARRLLGLPAVGPELDAALEERYRPHLWTAGPIERYVLLAFDAVLDDAGRVAPLPERSEDLGSDIYTSNSLVRDVCRRHPERFLFGASVHPYRPDALAAIEAVFRAGACLLKWIPLHHNIDPADERTVAALVRCAELGLPVLVHMGEEFTLTTQRPAYRPLRMLLPVLEQLYRRGTMPTVIVAHAATPVTPWGETESHRLLLEALRGALRRAPLYADISAMTAVTKRGFLLSLARQQDLHGRLLFGSDFPVPTGVWAVRGRLGNAYPAIRACPAWPQQAALACRALGFNEIVFHRAAELLPNVDFFAGAAPLTTAATTG